MSESAEPLQSADFNPDLKTIVDREHADMTLEERIALWEGIRTDAMHNARPEVYRIRRDKLQRQIRHLLDRRDALDREHATAPERAAHAEKRLQRLYALQEARRRCGQPRMTRAQLDARKRRRARLIARLTGDEGMSVREIVAAIREAEDADNSD